MLFGNAGHKGWITRAIVSLLFLCFVLPASFASDLLARSWNLSQDARQRSVLALLKSRNGYLWVGTGKGLLRFDGVDFTSFTAANTPGMLGDRISFGTLWEDTEGVIWAGTDFTGVLRYDHGHWQTLQEKQGLTGGKVLRIDGDQSGAVWIYTEAGVSRWYKGRFEKVGFGGNDGHSDELVPFSRRRTIDFAKAGVWRHSQHGLERFAYGHWSSFPSPSLDRPFEDDVREIYEDRSHRVWYSLFSRAHSVFCVDGGVLRSYEGLPSEALVTYKDRAGYLWLTDQHAHTSLWKDGRLTPLPKLSAPFLVQVIETEDGTLWAGTAGTDLFQFRRRSVATVPTAGSPEIASVLLQANDSLVWAGGIGVLRSASSTNPATFKAIQAAHTPANWLQIKALAKDPDGNLLIGSRGVEGLEVLSHGSFRHNLSIPGTIQALLCTRSGETWIGSTLGLYRKFGSHIERIIETPTRALLETASGQIVAGTESGPLVLRNGKQQAHEPWSFGPIVALRQDKLGAVWIATQDHGLVLMADRIFHVLSTADGLPTDVLYSLEFDDAGDLWMGSDVGLMRLRGKSIEHKLRDANSRLQVTVFDDADGLPASIFDPLGDQGIIRRSNGDLWFGTEQGVAIIRPSTLRTASTIAHPEIEEHEIDQSDPLPQDAIELRPGQTNLQIHYTALGSSHPEQLVFRYRLQNYDRDWVYAHDRRIAFYSHLAPGTYSFEVQVADNDGDGWITGVASTSVKVLTPFYRSWWFLCLLFLSLVIFLLYEIDLKRRRLLTDQRNRQMFTHRLISTQEGERKRIAHELHDSIGQHLVLIRTLAMLPSTTSVPSSGGRLEAIAEQAAVAIKEVETISYDLRPYQLDRLGLTKAVLSSVESLCRSSTIDIECAVDNVDDFFPKDIEISFYRIVQEALGNILRHAEASSAKVTVTRTGSSLRLIILDNGKGFALAEGHGSGLGLIGIHERAEALHGHALVESVPGIGTTITVEIEQAERKDQRP